MTRIRYVRYDNKLVNKEPILAGTSSLQVTLDLANLNFTVTNIDNGSVVASGNASAAAQLKMKAKQTLKLLGANFDNEIRQRGNVQKVVVEQYTNV